VPTPTPIPGGIYVDDIYTTDINGTPKDVFLKDNREVIYWRVLIKKEGAGVVEGASVTCQIVRPNQSVWVEKASTTGADGWALFEHPTGKPCPVGTHIAKVIDVAKTGETYDPASNVKDAHDFELE
jgi:hypothetical protein